MSIKLLTFTLLVILSATLTSAFDSDLVKNLPEYPYGGRMYSGYLDLDIKIKKLHYVFVESQSDPRHDPLLLWFNGGPGCSSMLAWAQEHGPCIFPENSKVFQVNPYSWNKFANVLYIESPAGVGFSYIESEKPEYWKTDDVQSGKENLQALLSFYRKFPNFKNNDLYISGESYAGLYVPYLAYNVIKHNEKVKSSKKIKIKGMLVGNGVTDWNVDTAPATYTMAGNHALISPEMKALYEENCINNIKEDLCNQVKAKMEALIAKVDIYDIYRKCVQPNNEDQSNINNQHRFDYTPWLNKARNINKSSKLTFLEEISKQPLKVTPPCTDSAGPDYYFNKVDVREALHINPIVKKWEMCSDMVSQYYDIDFQKGSYYLYKDLIGKIKILIYSGDTDGAVPVEGTRRWIKNLNLPVKSPWRSWYSGDSSDLSGYVIEYEGLTFKTIRGTGHMVPQWKPKEAFHMLNNFLNNNNL